MTSLTTLPQKAIRLYDARNPVSSIAYQDPLMHSFGSDVSVKSGLTV